MSAGTIKKVVHLSNQTHLPYARLVSGHNEKGYGVIENDDGVDVYFSHEAVEGRQGFGDLRRGKRVDYVGDTGPYLQATSVRLLAP